MSLKDDINVTVTEKINTGSIEWSTCTFPDPESILDWIDWCIEVAHGRGKPAFRDSLPPRRSGY